MVPVSKRKTFAPRAYTESWALDTGCRLDGACPSFLLSSFHGSDLRRQAIFTAMSQIDWSQPEVLARRLRDAAPHSCITCIDPIAQIARALIVLRPRDTVRAVFGEVPDGLIGSLLRLGADPLPRPAAYRELFQVFADPEQRARARALRQMTGKLTRSKLEAVLHLDPLLVHPNVVSKFLFGDEEAARLNSALRVIRASCSTATDAAVRDSIRQLGRDQNVGAWVTRWLTKADRLLPPPIDDPEFRRLMPAELEGTGRKWRNCISGYVGLAALGRACFLEYRSEIGTCLVQLDRVSNGWLWSGAFALANGRLDHKVDAAARARLRSAGVLMPAHGPGDPGDMNAVAKLIDNLWDWPFRDGEDAGADADALAGVEDAEAA